MVSIEIPCDLGSTIYELNWIHGVPHIITSVVCAIHITDGSRAKCNHKRKSYLVGALKVTNSTKHYDISKIGETVFLNYEDVERAIKNRQGINN